MNLNNTPSAGPLTAADLPQWRTDGVDIDAIHRRTGSRDWLASQPQCSGPCDQGRRLCPCPDSCCIGGTVGSEGGPRNEKPLHRYLFDLLRGLLRGY